MTKHQSISLHCFCHPFWQQTFERHLFKRTPSSCPEGNLQSTRLNHHQNFKSVSSCLQIPSGLPPPLCSPSHLPASTHAGFGASPGDKPCQRPPLTTRLCKLEQRKRIRLHFKHFVHDLRSWREGIQADLKRNVCFFIAAPTLTGEPMKLLSHPLPLSRQQL